MQNDPHMLVTPLKERDRFKLSGRCNGVVLVPSNGYAEPKNQEIYHLPADYYTKTGHNLNGRHKCSFSKRDTFITDSITPDGNGHLRVTARQVGGKKITFILKIDGNSPDHAIAIEKLKN